MGARTGEGGVRVLRSRESAVEEWEQFESGVGSRESGVSLSSRASVDGNQSGVSRESRASRESGISRGVSSK